MAVVIETTIGDLTVDLFTEERPIACLNFLKLCKLKYFNYNLFHTIEQGFIAQTGDPTGAGDGGSSVWGLVEGSHKRFFEAEYLPKIYHSSAGLLSLVSAGKNMVGSQFFFTLNADLTSLDGLHCVIGQVVEGHETLRKLNEAIVDENFRPYQDIRITHTVVLDDPYPDPRAFRVPSRSPSPTAERLKNGRIAADEDIDDTDGKTMEEIQEMLAEREAKARATILEIVGDLPDADVAPPENVLFVCKLNPVTTDDDLEIIFSRFGKIKSCEVIRDSKTGDSLQYAFVEFEDQKACEAAYFKMDNVLIDDRRIHVDFSQSVSKVKWRGKGRGIEGQKGRLDFNNLKGGVRSHRNEIQRHNNRENENRNKMTDEERRKAREERHRAQRGSEKNERRRSKSRNRRNKNESDKFDYRARDDRRREHKVRESSPQYRRDKRSRSRSKDYKDNTRKRNNNSSPEMRHVARQSKRRSRSLEKRSERIRDNNREKERNRRRSPVDSFSKKLKPEEYKKTNFHSKNREYETGRTRRSKDRQPVQREQTKSSRSRRSTSLENRRNRSITRNSEDRNSRVTNKSKKSVMRCEKSNDSRTTVEESRRKRSTNSSDKKMTSRRRSNDTVDRKTKQRDKKMAKPACSSSSDSSSDSDTSTSSSSSSSTTSDSSTTESGSSDK